MRIQLVVFASLAMTFSAACLADTVGFAVPADTAARYEVIERAGDGQLRTIVVKRVSPGHVWYAKREFDCSMLTTRYIGGGETPDEMKESRAEPRLGAIPRGSVAFYLEKAACSVQTAALSGQ